MMKHSFSVKLAQVSDIPDGQSIIVESPEGLSIVLFKLNGQIYAIENRCPHMGGPLGEGAIEDGIITCPWHGWQFDIPTGCCENMPGEDARRIPIIVEGNNIYLSEPESN